MLGYIGIIIFAFISGRTKAAAATAGAASPH
jgi:hypothetical protein